MRPTNRTDRHPAPRADLAPSACRRPGPTALCAAAIALGAAMLNGCEDPQRVVGQRARTVVVQPVSAYGLTLDESAGPREVAYVLLRAIKDDIEADEDFDAREAAFDLQLAVSAPDTIFERSVRKGLGRDENVRRIVWHWAPTLGHYKDDFPESWPEAQERMARLPYSNAPRGEEWTRVLIELADPSGDPNAAVVAEIQLVREKGFWRVVQVGFLRGTRHLKTGTITTTRDDS
jgi:hypothetical protein